MIPGNLPRIVFVSYRNAWGRIKPFLAVHLATRIAGAAILMPVAALLLALAISTSDRSALQDQEIALFLLTPAGFASALVVAALLTTGAVLDLSVMTGILRTGEHTIRGALSFGLKLIAGRFFKLFWFSLQLVLRVLLVSAPFLALAGGIAIFTLGDYDINYYLTYRPPAFMISAGLILAIALALVLILLALLSNWAVALHLLMFGGKMRGVFSESARLLKGRKSRIVALVFIWLLMRFVMLALAALVAGALIGMMPDLFGEKLRYVAMATIVILLLWMLGNAVIATLSNGALAGLLNDIYSQVTDSAPVAAATPAPAMRHDPGSGIPWIAVLGAAAAVIVAGIYLGGLLLDRASSIDTVEIIAHRGAAGARPENTMASVTKAVEDRADWIEIDVQENADGDVIVAHDSDFMKLGGVDLKTWNATREDIARIDIGSWYDPKYSGERTPTLDGVLRAIKGKARVIIELKYYGHDVDLEQRVADIVEKNAMVDDVSIMSLKYQGIEKMRALRPDWRYGVLAAKAIGNLSALTADFLAVNTGQVSVGFVRRAHSQGKQVYAWTVDDPVTMSRMISMGIDGLITNEPALARRVMEMRNELSAADRLMLWLSDRLDIGNFKLEADESDA